MAWAWSRLPCACGPQARGASLSAGWWKARPRAPASLANSAGAFLGPAYLHQMVRPGIGLYGGGPFGQAHPDIAAVATVEAPILQIRTISAGDTVGYGAAFEADRDLRVAIVAA